jgi:hypothetical protein
VRRFVYLYGPTYRCCCLKCGFLAFKEEEASEEARRIVAAGGSAGWFTEEDAVRCHKRLWNWEDDAPINVVIFEANRRRFTCRGFHHYSPGRSPREHLKLEDERRDFFRKAILAALAFIGALLGSLIGAYVKGSGGKP